MDSRETQCAAQEPRPPRPPRARTPATPNQRDALLAAAPSAQHEQPQPPAEDGNEDEQPPAEDLEDQRLDDATTAAAAAASASSSRLRVTGTGSSASATNAQLLANGGAQNAMVKQRQPEMEGEQGAAGATSTSAPAPGAVAAAPFTQPRSETGISPATSQKPLPVPQKKSAAEHERQDTSSMRQRHEQVQQQLQQQQQQQKQAPPQPQPQPPSPTTYRGTLILFWGASTLFTSESGRLWLRRYFEITRAILKARGPVDSHQASPGASNSKDSRRVKDDDGDQGTQSGAVVVQTCILVEGIGPQPTQGGGGSHEASFAVLGECYREVPASDDRDWDLVPVQGPSRQQRRQVIFSADRLASFEFVIVVRSNPFLESAPEFSFVDARLLRRFLVQLSSLTHLCLHCCRGAEIARYVAEHRPEVMIFYWASMSLINLSIMNSEHDLLQSFLEALRKHPDAQQAYEQATSQFLTLMQRPHAGANFERKNALLPPQAQGFPKRVGVPGLFLPAQRGDDDQSLVFRDCGPYVRMDESISSYKFVKYYQNGLYQAVYDLHVALSRFTQRKASHEERHLVDDMLVPTVYHLGSLLGWLVLCDFIPARSRTDGTRPRLHPELRIPAQAERLQAMRIVQKVAKLFAEVHASRLSSYQTDALQQQQLIYDLLHAIGTLFLRKDEYPPSSISHFEFTTLYLHLESNRMVPTVRILEPLWGLYYHMDESSTFPLFVSLLAGFAARAPSSSYSSTGPVSGARSSRRYEKSRMHSENRSSTRSFFTLGSGTKITLALTVAGVAAVIAKVASSRTYKSDV